MLKEPHVFFLRNLNESVLCLLNSCVFILGILNTVVHCVTAHYCPCDAFTHRLPRSITHAKSRVCTWPFKGKLPRDCPPARPATLPAG